jgi:hypothetical protein
LRNANNSLYVGSPASVEHWKDFTVLFYIHHPLLTIQTTTMFSTTPLHTTTGFSCGSNFILVPDDTDTETESDITMTPAEESKEEKMNISRRDRDPSGVTRDRFLGSRDTVSRNSAEAAAAVAQRDEMRRGRALGSEYSWHQQTFKLAVDEQLPKASGLLLLGRTPSGCDYAKDMEEEDAATYISDSSSYCARPTRMQMIHRPIPALFQDEERDTEDLPDADENDADRNTEGPQMLPTAVPFSPAVLVRDGSREESPGLIRGNEQQQNIGSYQFNMDTAQSRILFNPPGKYQILPSEQDWLELEPESPSDACFCMGYSLLDFLELETTATSRRRGQRSRMGKHRLQRSRLPLNTVEEAAEEGGADVSYIRGSPRIAPTRRKSELTSTTPRLKQKKDPVGDYEDPVGTYSSLSLV